MKDNPQKPADQLMDMYKSLKPIGGVMALFNKDIRSSFKKMNNVMKDFQKLQESMEDFKQQFGPLGWVAFDNISSTQVIAATSAPTLNDGEIILTDYFLKDTELELLGYKFNSDKYGTWKQLYDRAAERISAEDYISAIPLIFIIIDGICLKHFQRHPFSGAADEDVFDTYTSGPDALEKAFALLGATRRKVNDEPISLPYRHGIMHGVDTNFGYRIVTAKALNILRATMDYVQASESEDERINDAIKAQTPPKWSEIISGLKHNDEFKQAIDAWVARPSVENQNLAKSTLPHSLLDDSPEAKAFEYLNAIAAKNYGVLAKTSLFFTEATLGKWAGRLRSEFSDMEICDWTITGFEDTGSAATNVTAEITGMRLGTEIKGEIVVRCIYQSSNGQNPLVRGMKGGEWFVMPNVASEIWKISK